MPRRPPLAAAAARGRTKLGRNGHIAFGIRRAFVVSDGQPLRTGELLEWSRSRWMCNVWRVARQLCVPVGRARRYNEVLWKLRDDER